MRNAYMYILPRSGLAAALIVSAFWVAPAAAQYSADGLSVRPYLAGAGWRIDELSEAGHRGGGLGLAVGYGVLDRLTLIVDVSGVRLETDDGVAYTLSHVDLGLEGTLTRPGSRFKLFVLGSGTARKAGLEILGEHFNLDGSGLTLGFGGLYFMSRSFALHGSLKGTFGVIDRISGGGETFDLNNVKATSTRVEFGLAWFPGT